MPADASPPPKATAAAVTDAFGHHGRARRTSRRIPGATYRLQFHAGFTFRDAADLVPYLEALGISDCYSSSIVQAVPGSLHGYDVADPTTLNPELGTPDDFTVLVESLRSRDMGLVLDVVPNHMGIARSRNRWWQDVLENGPSSRYARVFDIDWQPIKRELADKVLLPILGDQYGAVLERQEIRLEYVDGAFCLRYFETVLPVAPRSYVRILRHRVETLRRDLGEEDADVHELLSIITSLEHLPMRTEQNRELLAERQREKEIAKRRLAGLVGRSEPLRAFIEENVRQYNGVPGDARSFDLLDALLGDQAYRLAHWRVASEEINYRRFFDINELAAVRMEDPEVFEEAHQLVLQLLASGSITGLRIDHVDGLYDPGDYLRRLQDRSRDEGVGTTHRPLYIVVEKILASNESLPSNWPVDGTTGYEFANEVNGLLIDGRHVRAMDEIYTRFTGERQSFRDLAYLKKKLIMQIGMASEIHVLAHRLNEFSERNRHYRDFTLYSLVYAIREIIACFPVYRTYVTADARPVSAWDRQYIDRAVHEAKRRNPGTTRHVFDFIRDLLLKRADYIPDAERDEYLRFVMRFQQTTSPVTAKGIEDTALYLYNRLVSLNEVGGEPDRFGVTPERLHEWLAARQRDWPHALSATSTHDTKRSEDVRARISVLSEIPGEWRVAVGRWSRFNKRHRTLVEGVPAPDRNEEYLLYQMLLGAWPMDALRGTPDAGYIDRICAYMVKALREGKRHSSWLNPSAAWEDAVTGFVRRVLDPATAPQFLDEFQHLAVRVAHAGIWNSLAQTLIKITAPGVPDFYQGTELWDLSLVDPDNRRPVDYAARRAALEALGGDDFGVADLDALLESRVDGRIKLYTIAAALRCRRRNADLFRTGDYVPLAIAGPRATHAFAFARIVEARATLTIVPRLTATLVRSAADVPIGRHVWDDTHLLLPAALRKVTWVNEITRQTLERTPGQETLRLADVLERFPVAVLTSSDA